jgi:hypothetical protein
VAVVSENEFTCAACGGTFEREPGWSQEHIEDEYRKTFGKDPDDVDVVCDDCYQKIVSWARRKGLVP